MTPQKMENTIAFITRQQVRLEENQVKFDRNQVKIEENFARAEKRFAEAEKRFAQVEKRFAQAERRLDRAEKRFDRLEELVRRLARGADERMKLFEARTAVLQEIMIEVGRSQKSVLEALSRYSGNGRKRAPN
jgi:hypothetical protein